MKSIIADAGYFIALFNSNDKHHTTAWEVSKQYPNPLISTWPVVTEAIHILLRVGQKNQHAFSKSLVDGACEIFSLQEDHLPRINNLMVQFHALPMDLADASLILLAEKLGYGQIFSTDQRDFGTFPWKNREPFENLLL
ncbi:MAG: PIN domain-containing protein [Proteobacteria bacterium]|nr:PIN domain-containing protein [Pseudomonadota bacterium]